MMAVGTSQLHCPYVFEIELMEDVAPKLHDERVRSFEFMHYQRSQSENSECSYYGTAVVG
jgi:hypothetical protein